MASFAFACAHDFDASRTARVKGAEEEATAEEATAAARMAALPTGARVSDAGGDAGTGCTPRRTATNTAKSCATHAKTRRPTARTTALAEPVAAPCRSACQDAGAQCVTALHLDMRDVRRLQRNDHRVKTLRNAADFALRSRILTCAATRRATGSARAVVRAVGLRVLACGCARLRCVRDSRRRRAFPFPRLPPRRKPRARRKALPSSCRRRLLRRRLLSAPFTLAVLECVKVVRAREGERRHRDDRTRKKPSRGIATHQKLPSAPPTWGEHGETLQRRRRSISEC